LFGGLAGGPSPAGDFQYSLCGIQTGEEIMAHGMVSAPQPEAVEAGVLALRDGGNAVDAAIACALVQTAVDPQMCGIAGFGSMHLYLPEAGRHLILDFHGRAPLSARPDMWQDLIERETEDGFGFVLKGQVNDLGYGAITTPMTLKAFDEALQRFGTHSLGELLEPAIRYADEGFQVRPHMSYFWNLVEGAGRVPHVERIRHFPEARRIYTDEDGNIRKTGAVLRNPDMAKTYRRIAEEGIGVFYEGALAEAIAADMDANGGLLSADDLAAVAGPAAPTRAATAWRWRFDRWSRFAGHRPFVIGLAS